MINLKTKLKAYPRIEPAILSNYYTKQETQDVIDTSLEGYVKDVENPVDGVIYGRSLIDGKLEWVNILGIDSPVIFKIVNNNGGAGYPTAEDLGEYSLAEISADPTTFTVQTPIENIGYLWVCSTKIIDKIEYIAGDLLHVNEPITFIKDVDVPINGTDSGNLTIKFHCYRTNAKYTKNSQAAKWLVKIN